MTRLLFAASSDHGTLHVLWERYNAINGAFDVGKGILGIDAGEEFDRD